MEPLWLNNYNLLTLEEIDSTNTEALRLANAGAKDQLVIVAKKQTSARGQNAREWVSLDSNLHASILIQSDVNRKRLPELSFLMANAMHEAVTFCAKQQNISLNLSLKWPNDILIDDKKLAGILLESINIDNKNYVVIGFGVNVFESPIIPEKITTSLFDEGIILASPYEFLNVLMNQFDHLYKEWILDNNFSNTRKNWMKNAYNLNKLITIDDGTNRTSGIFKGIGIDGSVCLELSNGEICNFSSGELLVNKK